MAKGEVVHAGAHDVSFAVEVSPFDDEEGVTDFAFFACHYVSAYLKWIMSLS